MEGTNMKQAVWSALEIERLHVYEDNYKANEYFSNMIGDKIVKYSKRWIKKDANILDYGCGPGYLIKFLLNAGYKTSGMDFTHESVDIANEKYKGKNNFRGAYYFDELSCNNQFDVIFNIEVIEHLTDDYLDDMFSKYKQLLTDDGIVIITTPNNQNLVADSVYCPFCDTLFSPVQHVRSWNRSTLTKYVSEKGFDIVFIDEVNLKEMYLPISKRMILMLKKLYHLIEKKEEKKKNLYCVIKRTSMNNQK